MYALFLLVFISVCCLESLLTNLCVQLRDRIERYHILPSNTYNFDEKGFLIGVSRSTKRYVSIVQLVTKQLLGASQDGNREFIIFIGCICADGTRIPPALIYKSESGEIMDTWLDDYDQDGEMAFFATSQKGWSNEDLGMYWLEHIFDRFTREKAQNRRRLLLIDGHNSHLNMRFIDYADKNKILLALLPSHSTHRLQPLDVGLFSPLATKYSQQIDQFVAEYQGLVKISKRHFWKFFIEAWKEAFTEKNILSAFESTGVHPFNPDKVLAIFKKREHTPEKEELSRSMKTPGSTRALRRTYSRLHSQGHVDNKAAILVRAGERLAANNKILRKENECLKKAVFEEKKKRKRGKAMKFLDEGHSSGQAMFFSPAKVAAARQRQADEEEAELQRKRDSEDKKLQAAIRREEKAREAQEKKDRKAAERAAARAELAKEKLERQAAKEAAKRLKEYEAEKRRLQSKTKPAHTAQTKKSSQNASVGEKRLHDDEEASRARKRRRKTRSETRIRTSIVNSTNISNIRLNSLSNDANLTTIATPHGPQSQDEKRWSNSLPLRSGRNVRLPARFR